MSVEAGSVKKTNKGDAVVEANETFSVSLGAVTGTTATQVAAISTGSSATGTIAHHASATRSSTSAVSTAAHADFNVNFAVTLDHAVQGGFDVAISSTNGTADGSDRSEERSCRERV